MIRTLCWVACASLVLVACSDGGDDLAGDATSEVGAPDALPADGSSSADATGSDDTLSCAPGAQCDDGDPCTEDDLYDALCACTAEQSALFKTGGADVDAALALQDQINVLQKQLRAVRQVG